MIIREAKPSDLNDVLEVETLAFGEPDEATLVKNLLTDPTAKPLLSLLACEEEKALGHVLFTRVWFENKDDPDISMSILPPLAVVPEVQSKGVGGMLIKKGLEMLNKAGVDLVFVLGHPGYYPKYGFRNGAGALGFEAPYPIPEKDADAWMVQELKPGVIGRAKGKLVIADAMNKPEYWRE